MAVFSWLVILLLLAAFIAKGNQKGSKVFIIIAFLLLFAVMGLRNADSGGVDSLGKGGSYPIIFQRIGQKDWNTLVIKGGENFNIGFQFLVKGIYDITGGDYQAFIIIISFFILFSYMRFIRKYSPSPIQSVLYFFGLLYFLFLFDALKQAVAMSLLLYSFDAIMEKKPIRFLILVGLASLMHFPALVFLPAYWIVRIKIGRHYLILLTVLLIITYIFRDQLLNLMLKAYGEDEPSVSMDGIRFLRTKSIIMIVIVISALILRPPTENDRIYTTCLVFTIIAIVFQTFCGYNNIFERLADYYFHTAIVFIPLIFENCKLEKHYLEENTEKWIKNIATFVFCSFAVWRFLSTIADSEVYSGFKFLWQ